MRTRRPNLKDVTWWGFVQQVRGNDNQKQVAAAAGVTPSAVSRWESDGTTPGPDAAAAFARHYGRPVLEAFIAAGHLAAAEAGESPPAPVSLDGLDDEALLDEVRDRMGQAVSRAQARTPPGTHNPWDSRSAGAV